MDDSANVQDSSCSIPDIHIAALNITVIIPCYNEAAAIATVVADFQSCQQAATIYVYDNNSGDDTVSRAMAAGARKPGACTSWIHAMLSILACNNNDNS